MPNGGKTVLRKCSLDADVPFPHKALSACTVPFDVNQLLSLDEECSRISGSEVASGLTSDAMGGDWCDEELTLCPDEDDGGD